MAEKKSKKLWIISAAVLGLVIIIVAIMLVLKSNKADHSNEPMEVQAWYACEEFFADLLEIEVPGATYEPMGQKPGLLTEDGTYEVNLTFRYVRNGSEQRNSYYCRAVYIEDDKSWGVVQFQAVQ